MDSNITTDSGMATSTVGIGGTAQEISTPSETSGISGIQWDDATWILTSAFIIFTMQSGFGLLESGSVSNKNEVNIMIKNTVDVLFGGLSYWMLGFGFSVWIDGESNQFSGVSHFFLDSKVDIPYSGQVFSLFFFQTSFATTATTIVSGSMAERTKLESYILFSILNTFVYCFPAHWLWRTEENWLYQLGALDLAGGYIFIILTLTLYITILLSHNELSTVGGEMTESFNPSSSQSVVVYSEECPLHR